MTVLLATGQPGPGDPADFTPAGAPTVVTWSMKRLDPPSSLYVTVDDVLRVACTSSQAGEVVTINYRLLRAADGKIVYGSVSSQPLMGYITSFLSVPLAEGFLFSIGVTAKVATERGQTWARLMLAPSAVPGGQPAQVMMADYVTQSMTPGWPLGRILSPGEGPGFIHLVQGSTPALGAQWSVTVPTGARWRVVSHTSILFTGAAAPARSVEVQYTVGLVVGYNGVAPTQQTASTNVNYNGASLGAGASSRADQINIPVPPNLILNGGNTVHSSVLGMDPGDQWTAPDIVVEEWLDNV